MNDAPRISRRRIIASIAGTSASLALPSFASAAGKLITFIRTSAPGSSGDTLSRLIAEHFHAKLDRSVIVDSKSGGGGLIALNFIRQSPADGSFVLMCPSTAVSLLTAFSGKPTTETDVLPIVDAAGAPITITVNPASGIASLKEFFEAARKDPSRGSIGVPSAFGTGALIVYQLAKQLNLPLVSVPYRGGAPLLTDLLGNQVPAAGSILPDYLDQHRSGKLRILAVGSDKRSPLAPDIPTFAEAGYPGYEAVTMISMFGRIGMPASIVNEYAAIATEALSTESSVKALYKLGLVPAGGTPAEAARRFTAERVRWEPVIKASGIKMNS